MFDIKGAKKVDLRSNKTTGDRVAKVRDVDDLTAYDNEATGKDKKSWRREIVVGVIIGLIIMAATAFVKSKYPGSL
ncbi:hypothetical protein JAO85_17270 [Comamonas sp. NyZ500]|uniref:hypothetical protein n=1 Tax=Comamonas sp. NyZ500 TaxID=2795732 RepID=UPI00192C063A|nr:hypothetical protein [Comamonas sp. NyZ500]MBL5979032.1 hypothetical protein [Comamonas sp. NyZ500]